MNMQNRHCVFKWLGLIWRLLTVLTIKRGYYDYTPRVIGETIARAGWEIHREQLSI